MANKLNILITQKVEETNNTKTHSKLCMIEEVSFIMEVKFKIKFEKKTIGK